MRYLDSARAAPGCPENNQNIFALVIAQLMLIALYVTQSKIRRRFAIPRLERRAPGFCRLDYPFQARSAAGQWGLVNLSFTAGPDACNIIGRGVYLVFALVKSKIDRERTALVRGKLRDPAELPLDRPVTRKAGPRLQARHVSVFLCNRILPERKERQLLDRICHRYSFIAGGVAKHDFRPVILVGPKL